MKIEIKNPNIVRIYPVTVEPDELDINANEWCEVHDSSRNVMFQPTEVYFTVRVARDDTWVSFVQAMRTDQSGHILNNENFANESEVRHRLPEWLRAVGERVKADVRDKEREL